MMARRVQFRLSQAIVQREQFFNKHFDLYVTCSLQVHNLAWLLSRLLLDRKKDAAQMLNALSHFDGNLIVSILQLDLFEHREGDRIDKDDATIDAAGVHDKDLLIALLQTEEFRL